MKNINKKDISKNRVYIGWLIIILFSGIISFATIFSDNAYCLSSANVMLEVFKQA
jgi:hypothetical protein